MSWTPYGYSVNTVRGVDADGVTLDCRIAVGLDQQLRGKRAYSNYWDRFTADAWSIPDGLWYGQR